MEALWVTLLGLHHDPGCRNEKCQNSPASQANHFIKSQARFVWYVKRTSSSMETDSLELWSVSTEESAAMWTMPPAVVQSCCPFYFHLHTLPTVLGGEVEDRVARKSEMPEVSNRAISRTQFSWKGISPFNSMVDKWPVPNLAKIYWVVTTYKDAAKCNYDIMMP